KTKQDPEPKRIRSPAYSCELPGTLQKRIPAELLSSRVFTAGIAPGGSCLEQPTRTVKIGHGSPPFSVDAFSSSPRHRSHAQPSQASAHRRALPPRDAS